MEELKESIIKTIEKMDNKEILVYIHELLNAFKEKWGI